jgi:hypothetical protein
MSCELEVNAASFGMNIFKYMMHVLYTRVKEEWQDLYIPYPQWLTRVVMDDVYYVTTLVVMSLACFAVGLAIGIVVTIV